MHAVSTVQQLWDTVCVLHIVTIALVTRAMWRPQDVRSGGGTQGDSLMLHVQMYVVAVGMILGAMNRLPIQAAQAGPGQAPQQREQLAADSQLCRRGRGRRGQRGAQRDSGVQHLPDLALAIAASMLGTGSCLQRTGM